MRTRNYPTQWTVQRPQCQPLQKLFKKRSIHQGSSWVSRPIASDYVWCRMLELCPGPIGSCLLVAWMYHSMPGWRCYSESHLLNTYWTMLSLSLIPPQLTIDPSYHRNLCTLVLIPFTLRHLLFLAYIFLRRTTSFKVFSFSFHN